MFRNLAREYSTTTGTSDCVLTGAVPGCNTWENAGVTNGEVVRYGIITYSLTSNRPTHSEVGIGSYNTSTNTLARTTVESSTNAGSKITLTGLSEVYICPTSRDISGTFALYTGSSVQTINNAASAVLPISVETTDVFGLASVASNKITIAKAGRYAAYVSFGHYTNGADYNGPITTFAASIGTPNAFDSVVQGYVTAWGIDSANGTLNMHHINVAADATDYIEVNCTNNSGAQIDAYINYVILFKLSQTA